MPKRVKYGGRSAGTPNKKTSEAMNKAERLIKIIEDKYLENDLPLLSPKDRFTVYSDMLEYVMPKLSRQDIRGNIQQKIKIQIVRGARNRTESE